MPLASDDTLKPAKVALGIARGDIQRALGIVDRLRALTDASEIPKLAVRSTLIDLKICVEGSRWTAFGVLITIMGPDSMRLSQTLTQQFEEMSKRIQESFTNFTSKIDTAILLLDSPIAESNTRIRQPILELRWPIMNFGIVYEKLAGVLGVDPIGGLGWISRLVEENNLGLNERWAAASCYLASMEIAINKAAAKLGISEDRDKEFSKRFNKLAEALHEKGKPLAGLSRQLPQAFWKLRNEVTHGGYAPSREELDLIVTWVKEMTQALDDAN